MATLFVRHEVGDYAQWRAAYDAFAPNRDEAQVRSSAVYRDAANPSVLTVVHEFDSVDAARAFGDNPKLRAEIARLDIRSETQVWVAERT